MIESLHSPHIARVKALISSKGSKERAEQGLFVAEGVQCARESIASISGPKIKTLYATEEGLARISNLELGDVDVVMVTDQVMKAMADTVTPQGLLSLCYLPERSLTDISGTKSSKFIYLHEIQDPGNAGTIIRTADAMGFDAVFTSPASVDMYSPKVVRSTAGSLWHIPIYQNVFLSQLDEQIPELQKFLLTAHADESILDIALTSDCVAIFGNEARGVDQATLGVEVTEVTIPMPGRAESLNLSAAASIVMFTLSSKVAG